MPLKLTAKFAGCRPQLTFYGQNEVMREEWRYAGFLDRLVGDFCDGIIGILVAVPAYYLIDRQLLGGESDFLDDDAFGATEVLLLLWFLWN